MYVRNDVLPSPFPTHTIPSPSGFVQIAYPLNPEGAAQKAPPSGFGESA